MDLCPKCNSKTLIWELLNTPVTAREIAETLKMTTRTVRRYLSEMEVDIVGVEKKSYLFKRRQNGKR